MIKNSLLSLALAGTLSATQFLSDIKDFTPNNDAQSLNKQSKMIRSKNDKSLSKKQIENIQASIDIMFGVNERTFTDFLPTLEISLQKWAKEEEETLLAAMDWMENSLNTRLKQYSNMKSMLKSSNPPVELLENIATIDKMSREAKRTILTYKKYIKIIVSIKNELSEVDNIIVDDFWLPVIEEKENSVMVKLSGIDEEDFDRIDEIEHGLNIAINSEYIKTIMVT